MNEDFSTGPGWNCLAVRGAAPSRVVRALHWRRLVGGAQLGVLRQVLEARGLAGIHARLRPPRNGLRGLVQVEGPPAGLVRSLGCFFAAPRATGNVNALAGLAGKPWNACLHLLAGQENSL